MARKARSPGSKAKKQAGRMRASGTGAPRPPEAMHVRDVDVLQKDATTRAERRAVLVSALANDWAAEDIDTLERIDHGAWHGWAMWPRA